MTILAPPSDASAHRAPTSSEPVSVIFLTLAAGSILYVVIQLLGVAFRNKGKDLIYLGVLLGLVAGFVTDMVVTAGGAGDPPARRPIRYRADGR